MNLFNKRGIEHIEFNSLLEFYEYITNTSENECFSGGRLQSIENDYRFTQSHSFEEAVELFKRGWQDMSEKLTQRLKVESGNVEEVKDFKNVLSVQGYQPVVPLFLNDIPNCMISRQMKPVKKKVITLNKDISYNGMVKIEQIVEQSIKTLTIIKKMENQNYRCNLNIILGVHGMTKTYIVKVRIKSANERLNINKLSFPLVHPSMLRRLFFRFIEVHPGIPSDFYHGYGIPNDIGVMKRAYPDEIFLPKFIEVDIKNIKVLEDLTRRI